MAVATSARAATVVSVDTRGVSTSEVARTPMATPARASRAPTTASAIPVALWSLLTPATGSTPRMAVPTPAKATTIHLATSRRDSTARLQSSTGPVVSAVPAAWSLAIIGGFVHDHPGLRSDGLGDDGRPALAVKSLPPAIRRTVPNLSQLHAPLLIS